ncbi:MAG TPA: flagellar FlbD family protein [bacterium]|nr:MAG: Flagellar protein (FlbD) [bacterium ADurb.Bin236]HOC91673.1 flagellar FlbD family protein [bacterium]HOY64134.1 flagellar FlbD family protein [bacterium]HPI77702.1 flagellar FlbD family protein [bacterium]HPN94594.1 flagellar FlbD family protein [bacterium]
MIELIKLNDQAIVLNSDLIEYIEATPDTMITMTTGRKLVVKDKVDEVVRKVIEYRRSIYEGLAIKPQ